MAAVSSIDAMVWTASDSPPFALTELLRHRGHRVDQRPLPPPPTGDTPDCDLLVIDIAGAPEDGLAALARLHEERPDREFLLLALAGDEQRNAAITAGADEILAPDLEPAALADHVTLLERRVARSRGYRDDATRAEQSHANLVALIENLDGFVLFSDCEGRPLFYNAAYAAVIKQLIDLDMAPGIKPHELLEDPAERARWDRYHARVLAGERFTGSYQHHLPDGKVRYFEISYTPVVQDNEVIGFAEFTRDVTAQREARDQLERMVAERTTELEKINRTLTEEIAWRKRTEEALRTSEARYRGVYDTAPLAFVLWGRDQRIMAWNRHAEQIFGWSEDEVLGRDIFDFLIPDAAQEQVHELVEALLRGDQPTRSVNQNRTKRGDVIICEWNNALLRGADGQVSGVLSLALDITERTHLEERLRRAETLEALGQLAGGIAHDFNNQLVGIMGFADLLDRRVEDQKARSYAAAIRKATQRSADLVAKLLAFARKGTPQSEPVDLHALVTEVITLLKRSIDKRITLVSHLDAPATTTLGDQTLLQSALLNLAVNGRDAMPDGGTLTFATSLLDIDEAGARPEGLEPGRYIRISVTDTGTGMDAATRDHIFEPFFTTKHTGTGMGLATTYGAIRSHHGAIRVTSAPGSGSEFELLLPLVEHRHTVSAPVPPKPEPRRPSRILVVDDEPVVRDVLSTVLRELGHEVLTFGDGERAVDHYRQRWRDIDLVIFDMVMPKLDGTRLFEQLRQINPAVRALLSSGYALQNDTSNVADAGVLGFLHKPYDIDTVEAKVRAALDHEA